MTDTTPPSTPTAVAQVQDADPAALAVIASGDTPMDRMLLLAVTAGEQNLRAAYEIYDHQKKAARKEQFDDAFARAQAAFPDIPKNRKGYGYDYADLSAIIAAVRGPLTANNLSMRFYSATSDKAGYIRQVCVISGYGHTHESYMDVPDGDSDTNERRDAAQKTGAARTYAARYACMNALGIFPSNEDPDGIAATAADTGGNAAPSQPPRKQFDGKPASKGGDTKQSGAKSPPTDKTPAEIDFVVKCLDKLQQYVEAGSIALKEPKPNAKFSEAAFIDDFIKKFAPGRKFAPSAKQMTIADRIWGDYKKIVCDLAEAEKHTPPSASGSSATGGDSQAAANNFSDMDDVPF